MTTQPTAQNRSASRSSRADGTTEPSPSNLESAANATMGAPALTAAFSQRQATDLDVVRAAWFTPAGNHTTNNGREDAE